MIPVKDNLTNIDTLPGEEIKFGIGDARWVMRSNAKLYSDITTAIIREYSTNAHDAHVMAGNPDPIEVTLPSAFNPYFTVQDFGVGMDVNDFREIYTQFGTSNKRESNDTNGTLGFGSKSGVAYTTQFSVTSVKNGIKVQGVVLRKPDWEIVLKVVSSVRTDEPNGTTIKIPVHNIDEFVSKANDFYRFWLPGRVLVNGQPPLHAVGQKIVDGLYFSETWNASYIVMGNVPYRINNPSALFQNSQISNINFVAYVDNGDVEFTPSREDLEYTDHTKATLQRVVSDFEAKVVSAASDEISSATTHLEAFKSWSKWTNLLGPNMFRNLEFNGDKFTSDFNIQGVRYSPGAYRGGVNRNIRHWNIESLPRTIVVTDFEIVFSSRHRTMVKEFANLKGWTMNYVIFTKQSSDDIDSPWIDKSQFVTWEEVKAALPKAPRKVHSPRSTGRLSGSWDYITAQTKEYGKTLPDLEDGQSMYYIDVHNNKYYDVQNILKCLGDDGIVVIVPANRLPKFLRENPGIVYLIKYAKSKVVKNAETLLSADAKEVMSLNWRTQNLISHLDMSRVADKHLVHLDNIVKNKDALVQSYDKNLALAQWLKMRYDVKEFEPTSVDYVSETYPLLTPLINRGNWSMASTEHVYLYISAVIAAEKE